MSAVGRAVVLPLWLPHSRIQVGREYRYLSLSLVGTLLWDKVKPWLTPLDSNAPRRE